MADSKKFEEMLERLINEDREGAEELFHEIVVEKSRDIYESLLESDMDDEEVEEATDEEVDESDEDLDESDDEEVDESDEDLDEGFNLDEFEVEADPMDAMMGGDAGDDLEMDVAMPDADAAPEVDGEEEEIEDRVMDLEDALADLKAEFDSMMDGDEGDDMDMDMDMDDEGEEDEEGDEDEAEEESYAFESDDEEVEEAADDEEGEKSQTETMREYVEKVSASMGDTGTNGTKSAVAGKNDMGGTVSNLNQSTTGEGSEAGAAGGAVKGNALSDTSPKDMSTGNVNVPGGKAAKAGKTVPAGHGAEKKGKPESADKGASSTLNKVSTRAK
jgi:hypothetical protein